MEAILREETQGLKVHVNNFSIENTALAKENQALKDRAEMVA